MSKTAIKSLWRLYNVSARIIYTVHEKTVTIEVNCRAELRALQVKIGMATFVIYRFVQEVPLLMPLKH